MIELDERLKVLKWETLKPHAMQSRLWRTRRRFPVVAAGRGSGKTELARRRVVRALAEVVEGNSTPEYFYGLPTYNQAKRVAWKHIKKLVPKEWLAEPPRETDMTIKTVFGSELHVVGFDKRERVEGTQWAGGVIDESSDEPPGLFDLSIRPALTRWNGWCWRIGVPKRMGVGAAEFKAAYDAGLLKEDDETRTFHWESADILSASEILRLQSTMDVRDFNEQYRAAWESIGGVIFHAFNEKINVKPEVTYRPDRPIVVGSDFNVNPMSWCLAHVGSNGLVVFDEIFKRNTNTDQTLAELYERYGQHKAGWMFAGDATGQARKSSAFSSDYLQIQNFAAEKLEGDLKFLYPKSNPAQANRFAACNAMFMNAQGVARCFISPKCKRLIHDLKHRSYKKESREPNDSGDIGHMSDAFGYIVYKFFPLRIVNDSPPIIVTSRAR